MANSHSPVARRQDCTSAGAGIDTPNAVRGVSNSIQIRTAFILGERFTGGSWARSR